MTVIVRYWRGTTQMVGKARTYRGAMRIADLNQNAWPPRFYDAKGRQLHDTGYGLAYDEPDAQGRIVVVMW